MVSSRLLDSIKQSEGYSDTLYMCPAGKPTIGYGTNIEKISKSEATMLLTMRVNDAIALVDSILGYDAISRLSESQRDAVYELGYWIGGSRFQKFKKMIKAIRNYDYIKASDELMDSKLGREYTTRAKRLAYKLRGGI
jgi:lysozyme